MFAYTYRRARTQPFTQAGTQLAGKGATNAVSPQEFTDFYAASFRRLVGQLYAMTGNHAEAQDAVQEAFIRAWAHRRQLERSGAPQAWVRATAWRIAVSRWQRARLGRVLMRSSPSAATIDGPSRRRGLRDGFAAVAVAGAVAAGVISGTPAGQHATLHHPDTRPPAPLPSPGPTLPAPIPSPAPGGIHTPSPTPGGMHTPSPSPAPGQPASTPSPSLYPTGSPSPSRTTSASQPPKATPTPDSSPGAR